MKLSVYFFLWKHRTNSKGKAPLYCRIVIEKKRKQFSTALFLNPKEWCPKKQKVGGNCNHSALYNQSLQRLSLALKSKYLELTLAGKEVTAEGLYLAHKGIKRGPITLMHVYDEYISSMIKLKGKKYALSTIQKFQQSQQHCQRALQEMNRKDIPLSSIKASFIDILINTALQRNYKKATINKAIKNLKQIIQYAIKNEYLENDPFVGVRLTHEKKEINYLTLEELRKLETVVLDNSRLDQARDCFIFSCYTGLAYAESKTLKFGDSYCDNKGTKWLKVKRKKTSMNYELPLFSKALEIMEKYSDLGQLPLVSNQKFNEYIKEVAIRAGIEKRVTHHLARKTFATTVCLGNGIPMEVTSKLLGHSSMAITETSYASITKLQIIKYLK